MQIDFSAKNVSVSDKFKDHLLTKLEKVERKLSSPLKARVVVFEENDLAHIEIICHLFHRDIVVKESHENRYTAADHLAKKLDRRLVQLKEKTKT